MSKIKLLFLLFLIIVFLVGLYVTMFYGMPTKGRCNKKEGFEGNAQKKDNVSQCPDLLVKKGNALMLYNTTKPIIEGENPIPFFNLDEYINYLEIQKKHGIICPVLFLQEEISINNKATWNIVYDFFEEKMTAFELFYYEYDEYIKNIEV